MEPGEPKKVLIRDVKTRWNSTYSMIKRALKVRPAIDGVLKTDPELEHLALNEDEWTKIKKIKSVLRV
ncbi:hypothetical protein BC940DRAFT_238547, partial [Gongronella butleri]